MEIKKSKCTVENMTFSSSRYKLKIYVIDVVDKYRGSQAKNMYVYTIMIMNSINIKIDCAATLFLAWEFMG